MDREREPKTRESKRDIISQPQTQNQRSTETFFLLLFKCGRKFVLMIIHFLEVQKGKYTTGRPHSHTYTLYAPLPFLNR